MNSTFEPSFTTLGRKPLLDPESRGSKESTNDLDPPSWMSKSGLFGYSDEEFFQALKTVMHYREVRALRKVIWILMKHRFHSVPHDYENMLVGVDDPEIAAPRQEGFDYRKT
jgi:hypothetical protein